ncbi:MAG: SPFH domain-containing protein [bacterium]
MEFIVFLAIAAVIAVLVGFAIIKSFLFVGRPNEVLIFSGRDHRLPDGSTVGYRLVRGGWAVRRPVLETADRMDLRVFPVRIDTRGAYSKGGIPLNVHAIANVKIASDDGIIHNAIERFLGRSRDEIVRVAQETLEGNLRGVLATLTPEEINENRLRFSEQLAEDVEPDLEKLGLHLDTLKIQNVSDDRDYLDSLGRRRIAEILKVAEIAESDCMKQAEEVEAVSQGRGEVARRNAQAQIQKEQNELRQFVADLELQAKSEEERAEARALEARAEAEQELQQVRTELEKLRLQADVVIPAEANKVARELIAAGEAAEIAEKGRAMAEVLRMTADAWKDAGENAADIFVLQRLEIIMKRVSEAAQQVKVREVALIDGGSGEMLPNYVSSFPKIVAGLFTEMRDTVGLDIGGALTGRKDEEPRQLTAEQPAGLGALTAEKKDSLARALAQRKQDGDNR